MTRKQGFYEKYIKRPLDIFCALLALTVFGWLYILIAILVRIKLGSPVIFQQPRPGKDEKIFNLYKFRTMTDERDENGNLIPDEVRRPNSEKPSAPLPSTSCPRPSTSSRAICPSSAPGPSWCGTWCS